MPTISGRMSARYCGRARQPSRRRGPQRSVAERGQRRAHEACRHRAVRVEQEARLDDGVGANVARGADGVELRLREVQQRLELRAVHGQRVAGAGDALHEEGATQ